MRTRKLASRGEITAHKIILRTLADTGWYVFANVSVQRTIEREEGSRGPSSTSTHAGRSTSS